jgi:hypothetical protein
MRGYGQCVLSSCFCPFVLSIGHSLHLGCRYTFPVNPEFNKASVWVVALLLLLSMLPHVFFVCNQISWLLDQLQAWWPWNSTQCQWKHRSGHVSGEERSCRMKYATFLHSCWWWRLLDYFAAGARTSSSTEWSSTLTMRNRWRHLSPVSFLEMIAHDRYRNHVAEGKIVLN